MNEAELKDHAFVSKSELTTCVAQAGLELDSIVEKVVSQSFDCFDDAVQSVRGIGAGRASEMRESGLMGRKRFEKIKNDIEQHIADHGAIQLDYKVAFVLATKRS
jgi:hypothetical protein